jgi:hypothetical protein
LQERPEGGFLLIREEGQDKSPFSRLMSVRGQVESGTTRGVLKHSTRA